MLYKLSSRYLESASRNLNYTVKQKKLFTLIASSIWIIGFAITLQHSVPAIIELPKYIKAKYYLSKGLNVFGGKNEYAYNVESMERARSHNSYSYFVRIDKRYDDYIDNALATDPILDLKVVDKMEDKVKRLLSIPIYLTTLFLLPWLVFRLVAWFNDDNESTMAK